MNPIEQKILVALGRYMSKILARSVLALAIECAKVDLRTLTPSQKRNLINEVARGIRLYVQGESHQDECLAALNDVIDAPRTSRPAKPIGTRVTIPVDVEADIVAARTMGREVCRELGFSPAGQIKVATAISELARNIIQYAGYGTIVVASIDAAPTGVEVVASDNGPGIADLEHVLGGSYVSKLGMGIGLKGVQKLMDECDIKTDPSTGTVVTARKYLN
jgi:serine/threonine-protein kinase RsbT